MTCLRVRDVRLVQDALVSLILVGHVSLPQLSRKDDTTGIIRRRESRLQGVGKRIRVCWLLQRQRGLSGRHPNDSRGRLLKASCPTNIPSNNERKMGSIALGDESSAAIIARKGLCSYYLMSTVACTSLSDAEHGQAAVL